MSEITTHFNVVLHDSPAEAPKYGADVTLLRIEAALIVGKGMESGAPSVDLQMVDDATGRKFLVMTTGSLLEMLGGAIAGKRQRDAAPAAGSAVPPSTGVH